MNNCERLIKELDNIITVVSKDTIVVSPIPPPSHCGGILISENTDLENMSKEQLIMTHTLAHFLYSKCKNIEVVEKLHKKIVKKLNNHCYFDKLDIK